MRFRCLVFGHDDRIRRERGHIFLECSECSRETVGWDLSSQASPTSAPLRSWTQGRELYHDAQSVIRLVHKRADASVDRVTRAARELLRSASSRRAA